MNNNIDLILKYFPNLKEEQIEKFKKLFPLYESWNEQINVISRKDLDSFNERHLLHSLCIAKVIDFVPQTKILDIGTGGGFPGIPLAIFFPEVNFTLVDSIGKKIKVVNEVSKALDLDNVVGIHENDGHPLPSSYPCPMKDR
jgi:16S rRNA (guanine527-N7)-methyltransferase